MCRLGIVFCNANGDSVQIRFLITVNDTWNPSGCIYTAISPPLWSGVKYNKSDSIHIGGCDVGPLRFNVRQLNGGKSKMAVDLTFYSSVIEDASPPTCSIQWNGTYLTPGTTDPGESLLPGCFVMDSREGYHMTYYWFHLLDWMFL
ncbi:uncharacterized protein LOC121380555 [Gigantopelta aegis]|uniref:uncharacterized protein LOC121380555 n=1 Tax=Gigantopelta aegis TaxID=1735272 RepID=UPI001B88BAC4|nr:uncharacterized protein LOC121380555 [Gigantopelta aegis]